MVKKLPLPHPPNTEKHFFLTLIIYPLPAHMALVSCQSFSPSASSQKQLRNSKKKFPYTLYLSSAMLSYLGRDPLIFVLCNTHEDCWKQISIIVVSWRTTALKAKFGRTLKLNCICRLLPKVNITSQPKRALNEIDM